MDIDDTFTPDNAWSTAVHDNDYSDADSQRMDAQDVITAADWSNPTQEATPGARPAGEPTTPFRMDQLFNYGGSIEYQNGELDLPGEPTCTGTLDAAGTCGPDPLLAEFQATDPATGKPYADDFGWISHTYDTPYLDVGCATQDYIEAELNENTTDSTAAPGTSRRHRRPGPARAEHRRRVLSTSPTRSGPTTPRCSCRATIRASPTWTRAPRPRSTRPTWTRPRQHDRGHADRRHLRVRGDRPVQRGGLDQHRPVPGLCDRRPAG